MWKMNRIDVQFDVDGDACAGWTYVPPGAGPREGRPVVVMAHGLSGTRRDGLGTFAARFAGHGWFALVSDHRGFGDSAGTADLFHPARQLVDWRHAIAFALGWPRVDAERVVTFGSSMGGGNALTAAAVDERVAAAISEVPFLDLIRQAHRSSPRVRLRMLLAAIRGGYVYDGPEHEAVVADQLAFLERHVVARG